MTKFISYNKNFNTLYNCIFCFSLLQSIFETFHAKEITWAPDNHWGNQCAT